MSKRQFKIFVAFGDMHIGVPRIPAKSLKQQLKDHMIKPLKELPYLDGIFIAGDLLHTALSLNGEYSHLYMWFVDQLYKIAKQKGSTILIIRGTASHDLDQLSNIKHYINNDDNVDFRIYETIEETLIWDDYKVLLLPDVKIKKNEEIEKYLTKDKKYDLIIGHGLIESMQFFQQESEQMPAKTYVFKEKDLIESCKGPVIFGHIHQFQHHKKHFFYTGPFTLLERGGRDPGYLMCGIYDKDRTKFKVEHYDNPDAADYYDFHVGRKVLATYSIDEIIEAIEELLAPCKDNDLITLRITRSDTLEDADKVYMLENRFQKDKRISIVKKIKSKKEEEHEQENKERKEKYSYIMDTSLTMAEILFKYYEAEVLPTLPDKFGPAAKITEDDFRRILNEYKETK